MPTYIYRRRNGEIVELVMTVAEMEKRQKNGKILHGGETLHRDMASEMSGRAPVSCSIWPMKSDAAGVNPDQIPEARAESIKQGVPTDFDSEGRAIFTSASHRQKYCIANGLRDFSRHGGFCK